MVEGGVAVELKSALAGFGYSSHDDAVVVVDAADRRR